jgi:hypothetical protein
VVSTEPLAAFRGSEADTLPKIRPFRVSTDKRLRKHDKLGSISGGLGAQFRDAVDGLVAIEAG